MTTGNEGPKKRKRLRAIEELYLAGYCAKEIFDLLGEQYDVTYGTVRNDIVNIRKMWGEDIDHQDRLEGSRRYLAALRQIRRKAMAGYQEHDAQGRVVTRGRSFKLAHEMDKEIARLSGVRLKSDEHTIHLDIEAAREYMDKVLAVVFEHVTDSATRDAIVAGIELLGNA